jgi:hypothetical protein
MTYGEDCRRGFSDYDSYCTRGTAQHNRSDKRKTTIPQVAHKCIMQPEVARMVNAASQPHEPRMRTSLTGIHGYTITLIRFLT